jgi:ribonuclease HI
MRKYGLKMNPLKCAFCVNAGDFLGFVVHKKGIEINQNKTKAIMETKSPTTKKQLQSLLGKINFLRRFISNLSGKAQPFSPLLRLKKESTFTWGQDQQQAFDEIKSYLSKPPMLMPPIRNKFMKLYISASDSTLGSMLAQEDENGEERAIYYLSRVLNDAETRYSSIEKLCLCLYFSCMKLKHYIKPVDVFVYSHCDIIKHMLSKPILHSRIGKWALALTEYSLTYKPLKAVKGQIVADFIADHSALETPQNYVDSEPWKLYFDGSKHKHGVGIGILIISPSRIPTKFKYKINGFCSNNEAEYEALITGLEILLDLGARNILIRGDSELVLKQLTKEYKCIKEHLMKYFVIAISLLKRFDQVIFEHVPRIENQEANDLAQIASGYKISSEKLEELIEIKDKLIVDQPPSMELSMPKLVEADVPQDNGQDTTCRIGKGDNLQNCHFSLSYSTCSRNWHF